MRRAVVKRPERWQQDFGYRLRLLREEAQLSQMQLGELAGLHPTYISSIERGQRNLGLINIRALALALQVPPGSLFD